MMGAAVSRNSILEKDVVQLIYCSQASRVDYQIAVKQVMKSIVEHSASRNLLLKITGALLTDGCFLAQIIEGPPPQVNLLYRRVLRDERHHSITLLQHTVTNIRLFPRWPMVLVEVDDMSYVGRLSVQSTSGDLRRACLSILKSLRPVLYGE